MARIDNNCKASTVLAATNNSSTESQRIKIGSYEIIGTIGHGNFAICKLAQHTITKTLVRLKKKASENSFNLKCYYISISGCY